MMTQIEFFLTDFVINGSLFFLSNENVNPEIISAELADKLSTIDQKI